MLTFMVYICPVFHLSNGFKMIVNSHMENIYVPWNFSNVFFYFFTNKPLMHYILIYNFSFWKINEAYCVLNASNLIYEFLYDNFKKNFSLNLLVKIVKQKIKLGEFSSRSYSFIFFQKEALRSESVNSYRKSTLK